MLPTLSTHVVAHHGIGSDSHHIELTDRPISPKNFSERMCLWVFRLRDGRHVRGRYLPSDDPAASVIGVGSSEPGRYGSRCDAFHRPVRLLQSYRTVALARTQMRQMLSYLDDLVGTSIVILAAAPRGRLLRKEAGAESRV